MNYFPNKTQFVDSEIMCFLEHVSFHLKLVKMGQAG